MPGLASVCYALPGICVSKITFHAHPYQTGLQPGPPWKVQAFPRTFHATPHHTTFCGLLAWKVIFVSRIPHPPQPAQPAPHGPHPAPTRPPPCPTRPSRAHPGIPDLSLQERNRPSTQFFRLMCHIRNTPTAFSQCFWAGEQFRPPVFAFPLPDLSDEERKWRERPILFSVRMTIPLVI